MNLEGDISEIQLVERLVELWREQFTGAIRFENDGIIKIIYFKGGDILSASTNDRADSIDEILMRAGKVSREHVKQALAKRKENETLGDALLNLGFITRKELTWSRRVQVVGVIRSIVAWPSGSFTIVADYLPKRDEGTLFPLPQILVELIVTEQDRQRFERSLDGGSAVFTKTADFADVFRRLGLNEEAETIVGYIDGTNNAAEVAIASGKDAFNVYKLLAALETLQILTRAPKAQASPEFSMDDHQSFATAGVADAADLWDDQPVAVTPEPPDFELDPDAYSSPTLEVPGLSIPPESDYQPQPLPEPEPMQAGPSVWDEEEEPAVLAPTANMPAWDAPPPPIAVPPPVPIEPPVDADEEQWGFDEAQIETVRRAELPIAPAAAASASTLTTPKRGRSGGGRYGLIIVLLLIAILAGAGYFGFRWWQEQQETSTATVTTPVRRPQPPPTTTAATATQPTATIVDIPDTTTTTTASVTETTATTAPVPTATVATTTTTAPAPRGLTITPPPEPPTSTVAIQRPTGGGTPVITNSGSAPSSAGDDALRTRYDNMARDFALGATGNFTVQFAIFCQPNSVSNALRAGGNEVWFLKHGQRCYRTYYGRYDSREEAQRALAALPNSLRDPNAKVVAVPK